MTISLVTVSIDPIADRGGVVSVTRSPVGASKFEAFGWPLPQALWDEIEAWRKIPDSAVTGNQPPVGVGANLFAHIAPASVRTCLSDAFKRSQGDPRTLVGISSSDPALHLLPFEVAHDGAQFLQAGNRIIFRHVNDGVDIEPRLPIQRILVALAEPQSPPKYPAWGHDEFAMDIHGFLKAWPAYFKILPHATPDELHQHLVEERSAGRQYDVILFVAHGEFGEAGGDGYLVLEDGKGGPAPLTASALASSLIGHSGCMLILISCNSATATAQNPLASVAHRAIHDGQAGAVIAMQRRVGVKSGLRIAQHLLHSLREGADIFTAFRDGIIVATTGQLEHGTPCLFARLSPNVAVSSDDLVTLKERLCLISLLTASEPDKCQFVLSLPSFSMGLTPADYQAGATKWFSMPPDIYRYRGPTTSFADLRSVQELLMLLGKLMSTDRLTKQVAIKTDTEIKGALGSGEATHVFIVGSRSHQEAHAALKQYSDDFEFIFEKDAWHILDRRTQQRYSNVDPSKVESHEDAAGDDYALLEKVVTQSGQVVFFIAGLWDTSTLAAGQYLTRQRHEIVREFGAGGFQIVLKVASGYTRIREVVLKRRPAVNSSA